jgi:hypothetical protein
MLLNVTIFLWYGAVCPWTIFAHNNVIPIYRLIPLGILILLLRRPPIILGTRKWIRQLQDFRESLFMGFFGPVGVSGIFYLYVTLDFLDELKDENGEQRSDVANMGETVTVIVWFIAICSVVSFVYPILKLDPFSSFIPGRPRLKHSTGQTRLLLAQDHFTQLDHRQPARFSSPVFQLPWPCECVPAFVPVAVARRHGT